MTSSKTHLRNYFRHNKNLFGVISCICNLKRQKYSQLYKKYNHLTVTVILAMNLSNIFIWQNSFIKSKFWTKLLMVFSFVSRSIPSLNYGRYSAAADLRWTSVVYWCTIHTRIRLVTVKNLTCQHYLTQRETSSNTAR